jgi:hypothetical protein
MTDPYPIFCWNTSRIASPGIVSCSFHDSTYARIIGAFPLFTALGLSPLSFQKKRVLVQLHRLLWYAASIAALYQIDNALPSVEQGCMQVLSTQILLQTPFYLLLPSTMFAAMLVLHLFVGNANKAWQSRSRLGSIQPT